MVAVATKEPLRHQTVLASKQRPANPASHLLRTTAADEQAGVPGNTPNSRALPLTTTRSVTEFRQPLQVQSHLEMPRILVQLGHTQRTQKLAPQTDPKWSPTWSLTRF